jgi:hypothetical protein
MRAAERIVAFFLLFLACLVWPILGIANRPAVVLGIPALVLYLFAVWAALVVVLVLVARQGRPWSRGPAEDEA